MDKTDYRAAANAAQKLAHEAWSLQSLHQVLKQLATDDGRLHELRSSIASLQAQEGEARARFVDADAKAHGAKAQAEALYAEQVGIQEQRIKDLKAEILALEGRREELTRDTTAMAKQNAEIRERLRVAVA